MLVGCEREIETLNGLYQSGSAELVALYGRRRVGNSATVGESGSTN